MDFIHTSELKVLVAAYAVSPYHSTYYRAASKPFNPLLGETYECIREDKGWRFISEQVHVGLSIIIWLNTQRQTYR